MEIVKLINQHIETVEKLKDGQMQNIAKLQEFVMMQLQADIKFFCVEMGAVQQIASILPLNLWEDFIAKESVFLLLHLRLIHPF